MKTLPEILKAVYAGSYDNDSVTEAQEAIAKELMGCLPEKLEIPDNWRVLRPELVDHYETHNSVIDEVRARLTAFIGKEKP